MRKIKVATVQPPIPSGEKGGEVKRRYMIEKGLLYLKKAGKEDADIVCLPEIFNVFGLPPGEALREAEESYCETLSRISEISKKYKMYIIYPALEKRGKRYFNSATIIGRDGKIKGKYDKTHPTRKEKELLKITPGEKLPVFKLDFGKIGIMICYDFYFPEVARILTLKGAEIIFHPSLQRHFPEICFEIQSRGRALDYSVYIVRSSYGVKEDGMWCPGIMIGRSCIIDRDGTIIADCGHKEGYTIKEINLGIPRYMERPGGDGKVDIREFIRKDRRPEIYKEILKR